MIAGLAPPGESLLALDFSANRSLVLGGDLDRYRIVHFATHGLIDSSRPELSGLVLSRVNPKGELQDGFLRLRDIYNLELGADLVVLSGCKTAWGREIRGEGLVGLTRGFMAAGVPRVVASPVAGRGPGDGGADGGVLPFDVEGRTVGGGGVAAGTAVSVARAAMARRLLLGSVRPAGRLAIVAGPDSLRRIRQKEVG